MRLCERELVDRGSLPEGGSFQRLKSRASTVVACRTFTSSCTFYFLLVPWLGWTEFCVRLPVLLGGCPSFLPSLPTCVMYSIGFLYLSGYSIVMVSR